jgi:trehalose 6-phosphate synthase/phosphatase
MTAPRLVRPFAPLTPVAPASDARVVIVSNRLPATVQLDGDAVRLTPSSGGLATGLRGVHERSGGTWIGWSGLADVSPRHAVRVDTRLAELSAAAVPLSADEVAGFYARYSNATLWPVLHDRFDAPPAAADWDTYRAVNLRFAQVVGRHLRPDDVVWVHDYHLMLVPRLLRALHPRARIGFFLHTPFPSLDALRRLPRVQRAALLDGLAAADVVAFHTPEYASRFECAARVELGRTDVRVTSCPMGIDVAAFESRAGDTRVAAEVARLRARGGPLLLGVDRLDYTKGIPERLEAFARLLDARPELRGHARLFQLAVPSREEVPAYQALRERVERVAARVNARFGTPTWQPIEYVYGSVDSVGLSALYRAADVMLVTPLRDGMNLVAKEFVASRTDDDGVLVLSERAGAAAELRAALLVDPHDVDGLARAYDAALSMSAAERRVRMRRLREAVRRHDVFAWAGACVDEIAQAPIANR